MEQKLTRRQARENAFLTAFSATFQPDDAPEPLVTGADDKDFRLNAFSERLLSDLMQHSPEIDEKINTHLKGWTLERIPRVSLVAIRVALAEMLYGEEHKPSVAINEAVELVKKYGAENDYQFVNGLLGSVARELPTEDAAQPEAEVTSASEKPEE